MNKLGSKRKESKGLQRRGASFEVDSLADPKIWESIAFVVQEGGAIRLGMTRDGGALAVGIYGDGDPYTEYLRGGEDAVAFFEQVAMLFKGDL